MGTASYVSPDCPPPFAAQMAEIEVDVETGQVTVTKLVMAVDCGVAINPVTASGQVEGGMLQALGYAHCEEFAFDDEGRLVNDSFGPYKIYRLPTRYPRPSCTWCRRWRTADHSAPRRWPRSPRTGSRLRRSST